MEDRPPTSFAAYEPPARTVERRARARRTLRRARLVTFVAMILLVAGATVALAIGPGASNEQPRREPAVVEVPAAPASSKLTPTTEARTTPRAAERSTPSVAARPTTRAATSVASSPPAQTSVRAATPTDPLPFTGTTEELIVMLVLGGGLITIVGMLVQIAVQPVPGSRS